MRSGVATSRRRLLLTVLPAVALLLLAASFLAFLRRADSAAVLPQHADGMVVLTGGADRVATALRLLDEGRARILLISGVGGDTGFAQLARRSGVDPALGSRVTLGRAAASTYGNALETAGWARANAVHSLIVVTAYYHMPRALAELSRALPGIRLYPVAVQPGGLRGPAAMVRLAGEYAKWLLAEAGLSGFASRGELPQAEQETETRQHAVRLGG